jgi:pilus assembly protein CpaE
MANISTLIAGRNRARIFELVDLFENQPRLQIQTRVTAEGDHDVLSRARVKPDILVLLLDKSWKDSLDALLQVPRSQRPELIIIAEAHFSDMMQLAMQAGARDYLIWDEARDTLVDAVTKIVAELQSLRQPHRGKLISVINGKGGAGGSFVTANLGQVVSLFGEKRVALIDLDLTFAPLPTYCDIEPKNSLSDALALSEDDIDETALSGYMTAYKGGVDVLANVASQQMLSWATPTDRLGHLIDLALATYDYVVVDTPRLIEPQIQCIVERADQVLLIVQQSLMHIREAKLLRQILIREFDITEDKIHAVINRFDRRNAITPKHIEKALNIEQIWQIPNDYDLASQSIEAGTLLSELAPRAKISKAFRVIAADLVAQGPRKNPGLFGRLFNRPQVATA